MEMKWRRLNGNVKKNDTWEDPEHDDPLPQTYWKIAKYTERKDCNEKDGARPPPPRSMLEQDDNKPTGKAIGFSLSPILKC
jgi:hypothetical protein